MVSEEEIGKEKQEEEEFLDDGGNNGEKMVRVPDGTLHHAMRRVPIGEVKPFFLDAQKSQVFSSIMGENVRSRSLTHAGMTRSTEQEKVEEKPKENFLKKLGIVVRASASLFLQGDEVRKEKKMI